MADEENWVEDYAEDDDETQIDEYNISASPHDFNVLTLFSFIESGIVKIPEFQRNFVWDRVRASKFIESLIIGIPVPQIFLYEQARNKFLVIDGQQRLMTIYYFMKKRFPQREKRVKLRIIFDRNGSIPESILENDEYFEDFKIKLSEKLPNARNGMNRFTGLNYDSLGDYKARFDLREIRNIVVRQNAPSDDDSSVYELFNRLSTGSIYLGPQEIRTGMYHSNFYDMLHRVNQEKRWRSLLHNEEPDIHMKDIEILLRGFAMLIEGKKYAPSLVKFLNRFSHKCETYTDKQNTYLERLFLSFLDACKDLPSNAFIHTQKNRFNMALFEAIFVAICKNAFVEHRELSGKIAKDEVFALAQDQDFLNAAIKSTTSTANVEMRMNRAVALLTAL
jgi:uncharacterized protein with ParB-like and HNH nuclease domain